MIKWFDYLIIGISILLSAAGVVLSIISLCEF